MMYGQGLIDSVQRKVIEGKMQETIGFINQGKHVEAFDGWNSVWLDYGGDYPGKSFSGAGLFSNYTGGSNTENIWVSGEDPNIPSFGNVVKYVTNPSLSTSGFFLVNSRVNSSR